MIIRCTNSPISVDHMKNRRIMCDFQNYKCDFLSCLQGKLLYGMTLNPSEDGVTTVVKIFCGLKKSR